MLPVPGIALIGALATVVLATAGEAAQVSQQGTTGRIAGQVVSKDDKQPLSGVAVTIAGTRIGAMTNDQGRFIIPGAPVGNVVVQTRRLGHTPTERRVAVVADQVVNVTFELDKQAVSLREVVVSVDVGTTRRVEVGSDIARVSVEDVLAKAPVTNVADLLATRTSGVDVRRGTGPVGTGQPIRVRGVASITNASNPLVIVDGIRVSNNSASGPQSIDWAEGRTISRMDDIDPNEISSLQVVKGPTATALYGSEAASGVIIIQTKRGAAISAQLDVNTEAGVYQDRSDYSGFNKYFNLTRYLGITDLNHPVARQFNAVENPVTHTIWAYSNPMTNPLTDPRRDGIATNTTASLRGGTSNARYFLSGRYEDTKGVFPNNYVKRGNVRANVDVAPHSTLQLAVSTAYTTSDIRLPESSRSFRGLSTNAGAGAPVNTFGILPSGERGDCLATLETGANSVSTCERFQGNLSANFDDLLSVFGGQKTGRFIGSFTALWSPRPWAANRLTLGLDNTQNFDLNEFPVDADRPFGQLSAGFVRDSRQTTHQRSVELTSTATRSLGPLVSTSTLGGQYFEVDDEFAGCTGEGGFASPTATACNAALIQTGFSGGFENVQVGAYLQQRFAYRDYAFVTAGVRFDENSAFGSRVNGIWSPSLSVSWAVSEMGLWKWNVVNSLRLRSAYGQAAQAPPPYAADERLQPVRLTTPTTTVAAVSALFPGNPDLGPERKAELEFGADADVLNSRFTLRWTHFRQTVTDAILSRILSPSLGYRGSQFVNVAKLTNNGHELTLGAGLIARPAVSWNVDLTLSTQDPIVDDLGGITPLFLGADRGMIVEGFAPGAYYGPIVESAQRAPDGSIVPGSIVYKDCPELPLNYCYLGNPQPTNMQSLATTVGLFQNKLRLNVVFDRRGNVTKRNGTTAFLVGFHRDRGAPIEYAFRESEVSPEMQAAMEQRLAGVANADAALWAEDGSFVRFREASVSYELPDRLSRLIQSSGTSVVVGGRNLATWTKFRGVDPESFVRGGLATIGGNEEFFGEAVPKYYYVRLNARLGR